MLVNPDGTTNILRQLMSKGKGFHWILKIQSSYTNLPKKTYHALGTQTVIKLVKRTRAQSDKSSNIALASVTLSFTTQET